MKPDWSKMDCGLFHTPFLVACKLKPEINDILWGLSGAVDNFMPENWVIDLKVHMLMPNQYPCIPNWHYDFVPRDDDNVQDFSQITDMSMYLWASGDPLPEFKDGREVKPKSWVEFKQMDMHRGTLSKDFCWRGFIRAWPRWICPAAENRMWYRRHSQVYLDAEDFTW